MSLLSAAGLVSAPISDHGDFRMPQGKGFAEMTAITVLNVVIVCHNYDDGKSQKPKRLAH